MSLCSLRCSKGYGDMSDTLVKVGIVFGLALIAFAPWLLANRPRRARDDGALGDVPSWTTGGDGPSHPHAHCTGHGASDGGHAGGDGGGC
jgi:hypothetical protein